MEIVQLSIFIIHFFCRFHVDNLIIITIVNNTSIKSLRLETFFYHCFGLSLGVLFSYILIDKGKRQRLLQNPDRFLFSKLRHKYTRNMTHG